MLRDAPRRRSGDADEVGRSAEDEDAPRRRSGDASARSIAARATTTGDDHEEEPGLPCRELTSSPPIVAAESARAVVPRASPSAPRDPGS